MTAGHLGRLVGMENHAACHETMQSSLLHIVQCLLLTDTSLVTFPSSCNRCDRQKLNASILISTCSSVPNGSCTTYNPYTPEGGRVVRVLCTAFVILVSSMCDARSFVMAYRLNRKVKLQFSQPIVNIMSVTICDRNLMRVSRNDQP